MNCSSRQSTTRSLLPKPSDPRPLEDYETLEEAMRIFETEVASEQEREVVDILMGDTEGCKGAIRTILIAIAMDCGEPAGFVTEHMSFTLFKMSRVINFLERLGLRAVRFRGLHMQTFVALATLRRMMTLDFYMLEFLHRLSGALEKLFQTNISMLEIIMKLMILLIVNPHRLKCSIREKILRSFAHIHKEFYSSKGILYQQKLPKTEAKEKE